MKVFKFRIETDEDPTFILDLEIRSDQTFKDLHDVLVKTLKFTENELASFYVADENWEKYEEITLLDMIGEEEEELYDDEKDLKNIFLMSSTPIGKFITETGQNLVYEYDFLQLHTFFIECTEVKEIDKKGSYPKIVGQKGGYKVINKIHNEDDPDKLKASLLQDFNSMVNSNLDDDDDDNDDMELDGNDDF